MKKIIKTVTLCFVAAACCLSFLLNSCSSGGSKLTEVVKDDVTYELYGHNTGVRRVVVKRGDTEICRIQVDEHMNDGEPYAADGSDGEHFGFSLCDVDGDGDDDAVIRTCRVKGKERYFFCLNDGEYVFSPEPWLSDLTSPTFGDGSGTVGVSFHRLNYELKPAPGNPPTYIETEKKVILGWDEEGKLHGIGGEALIYYSETDVYCLVTYARDTEASDTKKNRSVSSISEAEAELTAVEEIWIEPERLEEYGYEKFPPPDTEG